MGKQVGNKKIKKISIFFCNENKGLLELGNFFSYFLPDSLESPKHIPD